MHTHAYVPNEWRERDRERERERGGEGEMGRERERERESRPEGEMQDAHARAIRHQAGACTFVWMCMDTHASNGRHLRNVWATLI